MTKTETQNLNTCLEFPNEAHAEPRDWREFNDRFVRCLRLLYLVASRILNCPDDIEEAVENCFVAASRNPPHFEHETAFRGWLLRILINEAVLLLRKTKAPMDCHEMVWRKSA